MCLGEEMLSSSRTGRTPVETTLRAVSEVFSAGVFGSLLNVARSSNMALRHPRSACAATFCIACGCSSSSKKRSF